MLETVIQEEGELFDGPELSCFLNYSKLGCTYDCVSPSPHNSYHGIQTMLDICS